MRYHLQEWEGHRPETAEELFNLRQSIKRSRAELGNALLKGRFPTLRYGIVADDISDVQLRTQAIGYLHNFIQDRHGKTASFIDLWNQVRVSDLLVSKGVLSQGSDNVAAPAVPAGVVTTATSWRDSLAASAWAQYQAYLQARNAVGSNEGFGSLLPSGPELQVAAMLNNNLPSQDFFP